MEEVLGLIWRTLLIYFLINVVLRLMGKREIGKLSVFDIVISIMIAEMAVIVIEDRRRPLWEGILPIGMLAATQITIAYITLKSRFLRELFEGKPSIIITKGKLHLKEMRRQRYSLDDLLMQLREKNIRDVADVEFAVLETSGKLSVFTNESGKNENCGKSDEEAGGRSKEPASRTFLDHEGKPVTIRYEGLPLPLIMDGKVNEESLRKIGKTRFWLKNELQSRGIGDIKSVFLCTVDHRGKLFIDKKER
ncbi:DUF421 domain-containing protein [Paenibacillus thermotolerans]|uniref:YetF domain-containing protein n=1 Tax=Paenibacillus thermotolerans TaxID=3027807 RepID=UPI002367F5DD|nr:MULTISPECIES: DUF421 domain-containing protein [unclassified Paenibacillus]